MEKKNKGFTLVELLTVLAIVALLVGVLIPTLTSVKNIARETKQKAQFATIDLSLTAFKNDYGDYPPSSWITPPAAPGDYCGAQKLAEALFGWDLVGFHPDSAWRADGLDENGGEMTYDPQRVRGDDTLQERKDRYLELSTANVFKLGVSAQGDGLFRNTSVGAYVLNPDTYVLCDVFGVRQIRFPSGKATMAGTPILYFRADTSSNTMDPANPSNPGFQNQIYNVLDNLVIFLLRPLTLNGNQSSKTHPLGNEPRLFYNKTYKVIDPKVTIPWPHRPDSYILISAGADGLYGTSDDITNF